MLYSGLQVSGNPEIRKQETWEIFLISVQSVRARLHHHLDTENVD